MRCKGVSGSDIFNKLATGSIHQNLKIGRFQNRSNKVAIELSGVQIFGLKSYCSVCKEIRSDFGVAYINIAYLRVKRFGLF